MVLGSKFPLVSVGLPSYNNQDTVAAAIRSILSQTYQNWELILLDDGSTDNTRRIMQSFDDPRIKVVAGDDNRGRPRRRNQAVRLGQGKYFASMDGDDIAFPERLARQVAFMESNPQIDLVGTDILVFEGAGQAKGRLAGGISHEAICAKPWAGIYLPGATFLGRLEWFLANPFNEELTRVEDQELLLRTYYFSRFASLPDILYGYRVNSLSLTKILLDRYILSQALVASAWRRKKILWVGLALAGQILKSLVDAVAITSGLDYKILRHRAMPLAGEVIRQWEEVWVDCENGRAHGEAQLRHD